MHNLFRGGPKGGKKGGKYSDKELAKALDRALRRTDMLGSNIVGGIASTVEGFVDKVRDIGGYLVGEITGVNEEKAAQIELDNETAEYAERNIAERNHAKFMAKYSGL